MQLLYKQIMYQYIPKKLVLILVALGEQLLLLLLRVIRFDDVQILLPARAGSATTS